MRDSRRACKIFHECRGGLVRAALHLTPAASSLRMPPSQPRVSPRSPVGRRTAGIPNKVNSARVERALREGKRLPPEELLRNADNCRSMALRYHPMRRAFLLVLNRRRAW
jgi:hypothetical protein